MLWLKLQKVKTKEKHYKFYTIKNRIFLVFLKMKIKISSKDSTLIVKLGTVLISWLIELKLILKKVIFNTKTEKRIIFMVGNKLNKYYYNNKVIKPII